MTNQFDYVVIGAGSAGCVLANRLSADGTTTVALLEAGGRDWNPRIHVPVGYFKTIHNPNTDWCYVTEPDPGLDGRSLTWPRGKVLGGSSSIKHATSLTRFIIRPAHVGWSLMIVLW